MSLWPVARRKLDQLRRARDLRDLAVPLGNHLEALKGGRKGQHSVRINQQYRICFTWENDATGGMADAVEIVDYH